MARDLARMIRETALANRSPVYKWLEAHHAEIVKAMGVRGFWNSLAAAATEAGVTITKAGKEAPPTVAALRSAWLRVVADKASRAAAPDKPEPPPARKERPATTAPAVSAESTSPSRPARPDDIPSDDEPPRIIEPRSKFHLRPGEYRVKPPKGN